MARPFEESNYNALMLSILNTLPVPITDLGVGDEELWRILERGLAKDRDKRWQSVGDLGQALAAWGLRQGMLHDVTGAALDVHWPDPTAPPVSWTSALFEPLDAGADPSAGATGVIVARRATATAAPDRTPPVRGLTGRKELVRRAIIIASFVVASIASFVAWRGTGANDLAPVRSEQDPRMTAAPLPEVTPPVVVEAGPTLLPKVEPSVLPKAEPSVLPKAKPSRAAEPAAPPIAAPDRPTPPEKTESPRPTSSGAKDTLPPLAPNF